MLIDLVKTNKLQLVQSIKFLKTSTATLKSSAIAQNQLYLRTIKEQNKAVENCVTYC